MAVNIANLNIRIGANIAPMVASLAQGRAALQSFGLTLPNIAANAVRAAAAIAAMATAGAAYGLKLAAENEAATTSFKVMLGSLEASVEMLKEIREFAKVSPFGTSGLRDAAQTMLQFGVAGDDVMPMLKVLGDVSGGNAERLQHMALAFAQTSAAGRLMGQDLLQMINAGFNPLQQISQMTGETMLELKQRMEAGGVSSLEVTRAFIAATQAGGKFNGMMSEQAKTLSGKWATLKDEVEELALSIGEELLPAGKAFVEWTRIAVQGLEDLRLKVLGLREIAAQAFPEIATHVGNFAAGFSTILNTMAGFSGNVSNTADVDALADRVEEAFRNIEQVDPLKTWAEGMAEKLLLPIEKAAIEAAKLEAAFKAGYLSSEDYSRGLERIIGTLDEVKEVKQEIDAIDRGTGAATRFSQAGFSAVASAQSSLRNTMQPIAQATRETATSTSWLVEYFRNQQQSLIPVGVR